MTSTEIKSRIRATHLSHDDREKILALATVSAATLALALHQWERLAPKPLRRMLLGEWKWDERLQGFVGPTGRVVAGMELKAALTRFIQSIKSDMRRSVALLLLGRMPLDFWEKHQAELTVAAFLVAAMLAGGGLHLGENIKELVIGKPDEPSGLAFSLNRLTILAAQIQLADAAKIKLPGMTPADRVAAAAESAIPMFEAVRRQSHMDAVDANGVKLFTRERNILGEAEQHCHNSKHLPGCVELTERKWQPIGTLPLPGRRTCSYQCKCRIIYS